MEIIDRASLNTLRSPRSSLSWKERLDLPRLSGKFSLKDFKGGWRVEAPPKKDEDKIFDEKFSWMSKKKTKTTIDVEFKKKKKRLQTMEWHERLKRPGVQALPNASTTKVEALRHLPVRETQTCWVSWGSNASGVLAQGDAFNDVAIPKFTRLTKHPMDIAIGGNHIVAVDRNRTSIYTWGKNESGQLGNGTISQDSTSVPYFIGELNTKSKQIEQIEQIEQETKKTTTSKNKRRQQAIERQKEKNAKNKANKIEIVEDKGEIQQLVEKMIITKKLLKWRRRSEIFAPSIRLTSRVQKISCGWDHTIVLTVSGQAYGWGSNSKGQLGIGNGIGNVFIQKNETIVSMPTRIQIDDQDIAIIGVSTGRAHSLLLRGDGSVYGCGDNKYNQLGLNTKNINNNNNNEQTEMSEMVTTPGRIEWTSSQTVIEICCGWQFSAARTHSGQVFTWGDNRKGQCGHMIKLLKTIPHPIAVNFGCHNSTSSIVRIACGWSHMLALDKSGAIFSWGRSDMGQLGIGESMLPQQDGIAVFKITMPNAHKRENKIVQISCGSEHSMAVTSGGDLYSWGWGEHGNLGHGTTTNQMVPTRVTKFGAESGCYVKDIRSGGASVFARVSRTVEK